MKKILFVISLIATFLLVGCNQNKNKPTENMQQEITETNNPTLENNEWKYINRSINGKELIDENGKFSEELYIEGEGFYSLGMDYSGFFIHKDESDISLLTSSKYKVIKQYPDLHVYDIEMLEDSTWGIALDVNFEKFDSDGNWIGEIENEEHIPAGSIVEKVQIHSLKQI